MAWSHAEYRARRVFRGLDGLRALAVIAVVWHHTGTPAWLPMTANGFLGVDVFFVLSGLLIVTLLLRERERHGRISLRDFYVRRTLRIFPLYYAILFGLLAVHRLAPNVITSAAAEFAPFLFTYTADMVVVPGALSVAWSLAAEEQFYVVWPAVERWLPRAWWLVWLFGIGLSQLFNFQWLPDHGLHILQSTFTPILLGVALAHGLHEQRGFDALARWLGRPAAPWICCAVLIGLCNIPGSLAGVPRLAIHLTVAALLGAIVIRDDTLGGILDAWPLRRIGVVSYGVYLLHMFVMAGVDRVAPSVPSGARFVAVLVGTWALAEVSYHAFERRFLALKRRFAR